MTITAAQLAPRRTSPSSTSRGVRMAPSHSTTSDTTRERMSTSALAESSSERAAQYTTATRCSIARANSTATHVHSNRSAARKSRIAGSGLRPRPSGLLRREPRQHCPCDGRPRSCAKLGHGAWQWRAPVDFAPTVAIRRYLVAAKCSCPGGEIGSTRTIRRSRFNVDFALQQYLSAHVAAGQVANNSV
jgi:hypothetical protein